jgi:hypothetical protein
MSVNTETTAIQYPQFIVVSTATAAPTVAASKGTLALNLTGVGTSSRAFINTDGSTTWTAVTTAA